MPCFNFAMKLNNISLHGDLNTEELKRLSCCLFSGHHSTATITLDKRDDRTELNLTQTGVPEDDYERTKEGWKRHYWDTMKQTFFWGTKYF